MTAPMREMRRDLEALASLDHAEVPHEYGDVRFLVQRATSTVFAELDVHVYEFPATENLEE